MTGLPVIRLGGPDTGSAPGALDRRQWVGAQRRLGGKTRCVSTWRRPDPISPSVRLYALIWGDKPKLRPLRRPDLDVRLRCHNNLGADLDSC